MVYCYLFRLGSRGTHLRVVRVNGATQTKYFTNNAHHLRRRKIVRRWPLNVNNVLLDTINESKIIGIFKTTFIGVSRN